ncbi:hypothetical protein HD554DRAFT_2222504 [Boletus coccyginus]|nr:hypothetical protein HD554DRAFT_2222504 [Boletus coccyginus]
MVVQSLSVLEVFAMSQTIDLITTFLAYILPPLMCQYLIGVLVQLEGTRTYRMALLPVTMCLAWRATFMDMSGGGETKAQMNTTLVTQMCVLGMRSAVWAFARVRYRRYSPVDDRNSDSVSTACWNAWDLLINPRGVGWSWPRGLVIPKPALEADSRVGFVLPSAVGVVFHAVAFDACVQTIRIFSPETFGSLKGGSLFDHTLPPPSNSCERCLYHF